MLQPVMVHSLYTYQVDVLLPSTQYHAPNGGSYAAYSYCPYSSFYDSHIITKSYRVPLPPVLLWYKLQPTPLTP